MRQEEEQQPDAFSMPSFGALQRLKEEQALNKQLAGVPVSEEYRARLTSNSSAETAGTDPFSSSSFKLSVFLRIYSLDDAWHAGAENISQRQEPVKRASHAALASILDDQHRGTLKHDLEVGRQNDCQATLPTSTRGSSLLQDEAQRRDLGKHVSSTAAISAPQPSQVCYYSRKRPCCINLLFLHSSNQCAVLDFLAGGSPRGPQGRAETGSSLKPLLQAWRCGLPILVLGRHGRSLLVAACAPMADRTAHGSPLCRRCETRDCQR